MGPLLRLSPLAVVLLLLSGGAAATAADADGPGGLVRKGASAEYVPGEVLVKFRSGVSAAARASAARALGAEVEPADGPAPVTLVDLPDAASVPFAVAALESRADVVYAEPNYLHRLTALPNDTNFGTLWGLHQTSDKDIDAPEAWDTKTGHSAVVVAVIDSGVAYDHPDLAGNIWTNDDPPGGGDQDKNGFVDDTRGWDFVQKDNKPLDFNGHGTHVAGTIGAVGNNALGVTGVNWDVSIMPVRAADFGGSLTSAAITSAILYACKEGAHVVNGSFGSSTMSTAVRDAVKSAHCANTLFVFAAGNSNRNLETNTSATNAYPCELHRPVVNGGADATNVICVAASTETDARASFSNYGGTAVHLAAPGTNINSSVPGYKAVSGTSEGFEGSNASFNARWGNRLGTGGSPQWNRTTARKKSGKYSLADSPGGNYKSSSVRTIRRLGPYNLKGKVGCIVDYYLRLTTLSNDWFEIWVGPKPSTAKFAGAWSGTTQGKFVNLADDLSALDGRAKGYLRLVFRSNAAGTADGAYVDDMIVGCLNATANVYQSFEGTSMASPHVAGVAALLLSKSGLTVAQLKTAILTTTDPAVAWGGIVSTGGRLNADKAIDSIVAADATAPETTLLSVGGMGVSNLTGFSFRANEPATFECRLDGGSWEACTPLKSYTGLTQSDHTFEVKAIDLTGNEDATPASRTWTVDTIAPDTTLTKGPTGTVKSKSALFRFTGSEAGSTFQCKLDNGAYTTCSSGKAYSKLKKGKHTFLVRAKDPAGNIDATPAKRTWTIK